MTSSGEHQRRHPRAKTIYVDFDATLNIYNGWNGGAIGPPVDAMVQRVKRAHAAGHKIVIFTARLAEAFQNRDPAQVAAVAMPIKVWCLNTLGFNPMITCIKGIDATEFWDDRAVRVEANTGLPGTLDGTLWASLDE